MNTARKKRLDRLSKAMSCSRSSMAAEGIRDFVALNDWRREETRKALAEADHSDFASTNQVHKTMSKWISCGH